jgi:putative endonuclease
MAKTDAKTEPAKVAAPERVAAFRTGLSAEARAAAYLMAKGYRILAKSVFARPMARSTWWRGGAT